MRNDFSSAIRCLRNTVGFIEGTSLNDIHSHFVIQKAGVPFGTPSHDTVVLGSTNNASGFACVL